MAMSSPPDRPAGRPAPSPDELGAVKEAILIGLVMAVFERDAKVLEESRLKTKQPYLDLLQRAMDGASADLTKLRVRLRESGIRIAEEHRDDTGIGCEYWCRGYRSRIELLWNSARAETEIRMRQYLGEDVAKYARPDVPPHLQPAWGKTGGG